MQNILKGILLMLFGVFLMLFALLSEIANFYFFDLSVDLPVIFACSGFVSAIIGLVTAFRSKKK